MQKNRQNPAEMPETEPKPKLPVSGRAEFREKACELARAARMSLVILSHNLEREVYGESDFADAVRGLAVRHQHARIRILVHSPEWASRSGHRLVELMRQLTTFIEIRELAEEDRDIVTELILADEKGVLVRESPQHLEAVYRPDAPQHARQWLHKFEELWQRAQPAQGLRRLHM
jgi:hypothetical protein